MTRIRGGEAAHHRRVEAAPAQPKAASLARSRLGVARLRAGEGKPTEGDLLGDVVVAQRREGLRIGQGGR